MVVASGLELLHTYFKRVFIVCRDLGMGWKGNILLSTAIPPLAVQEFSTFVRYCGLSSVQTFIERGSVMQIPVLYSTNCNYHTKVSIILVVQMVSCSMEVDRKQSSGP